MATVTADRNEINITHKSSHSRLRIALIYPNSYHVGMSNLAIHALYDMFNTHDEIVCERAFLPDTNDASPIRTIESNTAVTDMDVIAFSISYELDYPNVLRILLRSGINPLAKERAGKPLVIAGGATINYNPEPLAPFLDAAVIGETEEIIDQLLNALQERVYHGNNMPLEKIPGVYLPENGTTPTTRLHVSNINAQPIETKIFSDATEFGHMFLSEVARGCPYGCRFCVASHLYRPARWRTLEVLWPGIEFALKYRKRIGLIGASVTDHPEILAICEKILAHGGQPSPASMRADALSNELLALLQRADVRSITLAPEAGREELRQQVGKKLSNDSLFSAANRAREAGIRHLKLYFIAGLPGEEEADIEAIPALVKSLQKESGMRISLGCSSLVPKPGTPFSHQAMTPVVQVKKKFATIARLLHGTAEFHHESARWAYWQAVLARGSRDIAPALLRIAQREDTPALWKEAFTSLSINADYYALREIPRDEITPWEHIGAAGK